MKKSSFNKQLHANVFAFFFINLMNLIIEYQNGPSSRATKQDIRVRIISQMQIYVYYSV